MASKTKSRICKYIKQVNVSTTGSKKTVLFELFFYFVFISIPFSCIFQHILFVNINLTGVEKLKEETR